MFKCAYECSSHLLGVIVVRPELELHHVLVDGVHLRVDLEPAVLGRLRVSDDDVGAEVGLLFATLLAALAGLFGEAGVRIGSTVKRRF